MPTRLPSLKLEAVVGLKSSVCGHCQGAARGRKKHGRAVTTHGHWITPSCPDKSSHKQRTPLTIGVRSTHQPPQFSYFSYFITRTSCLHPGTASGIIYWHLYLRLLDSGRTIAGYRNTGWRTSACKSYTITITSSTIFVYIVKH